jgi:hypothetical protein
MDGSTSYLIEARLMDANFNLEDKVVLKGSALIET